MCVGVAPKVVAHLISSDLGIQYDEALNVLRDEAAWEYAGMIDSTPDFIKKVDLYMPLLEKCSIKLNDHLDFRD